MMRGRRKPKYCGLYAGLPRKSFRDKAAERGRSKAFLYGFYRVSGDSCSCSKLWGVLIPPKRFYCRQNLDFFRDTSRCDARQLISLVRTASPEPLLVRTLACRACFNAVLLAYHTCHEDVMSPNGTQHLRLKCQTQPRATSASRNDPWVRILKNRSKVNGNDYTHTCHHTHVYMSR